MAPRDEEASEKNLGKKSSNRRDLAYFAKMRDEKIYELIGIYLDVSTQTERRNSEKRARLYLEDSMVRNASARK